MVLEKTFESPLECKEIKLVNPEGNQPLIFIERTDAEAPGLWPPDGKSQLIGKLTEDEMVGWHHRFNGHEFKEAQGVGDGQGNLLCSSPWG